MSKVTVKEIATGREFQLTKQGAENLVSTKKNHYEIMTKSAPKTKIEEIPNASDSVSSTESHQEDSKEEIKPEPKKRGRKPSKK